MKEISTIISNIRTDIKAVLPALLIAHGADVIDTYTIGYATDQEKKSCGVYFSEMDEAQNETFSFGINLQLNQVSVQNNLLGAVQKLKP